MLLLVQSMARLDAARLARGFRLVPLEHNLDRLCLGGLTDDSRESVNDTGMRACAHGTRMIPGLGRQSRRTDHQAIRVLERHGRHLIVSAFVFTRMRGVVDITGLGSSCAGVSAVNLV